MKSYSDSIHNLVYNTDASHLFQNDAIEVVIPETKEELIDSVKTAIKENKRIICRAG
ncbi:FAD-binding oxidoreductase [bacterium]|nr:FAD-binding oxidoreductase [bacterium]